MYSYGQYCFLPLYVFCGERLLMAYQRDGSLPIAWKVKGDTTDLFGHLLDHGWYVNDGK